MRKLFLLFLICSINVISYGQCEKKVTFKCNSGRAFSNGSFGEDLPIDATLSIENGKVTFTGTLNGETGTATGEITEVTICEWTQYLQNGKTQYKAYMTKSGNDAEKSIILIEGENGKIKLTFSSDPDIGSKLELDVTEFTVSENDSVNASKIETSVKKQKTKKKQKMP